MCLAGGLKHSMHVHRSMFWVTGGRPLAFDTRAPNSRSSFEQSCVSISSSMKHTWSLYWVKALCRASMSSGSVLHLAVNSLPCVVKAAIALRHRLHPKLQHQMGCECCAQLPCMQASRPPGKTATKAPLVLWVLLCGLHVSSSACEDVSKLNMNSISARTASPTA